MRKIKKSDPFISLLERALRAYQKSMDWQRQKFTVHWDCASLKREKVITTNTLWNISGMPAKSMKKLVGFSCGQTLLKACGGIIPVNTALSVISRK